MARYHEVMVDKTERSQIGGDRVVPRSIRALAINYYDSAAFRLRPITQNVYRHIVDRFCRERILTRSPRRPRKM